MCLLCLLAILRFQKIRLLRSFFERSGQVSELRLRLRGHPFPTDPATTAMSSRSPGTKAASQSRPSPPLPPPSASDRLSPLNQSRVLPKAPAGAATLPEIPFLTRAGSWDGLHPMNAVSSDTAQGPHWTEAAGSAAPATAGDAKCPVHNTIRPPRSPVAEPAAAAAAEPEMATAKQRTGECVPSSAPVLVLNDVDLHRGSAEWGGHRNVIADFADVPVMHSVMSVRPENQSIGLRVVSVTALAEASLKAASTNTPVPVLDVVKLNDHEGAEYDSDHIAMNGFNGRYEDGDAGDTPLLSPGFRRVGNAFTPASSGRTIGLSAPYWDPYNPDSLLAAASAAFKPRRPLLTFSDRPWNDKDAYAEPRQNSTPWDKWHYIASPCAKSPPQAFQMLMEGGDGGRGGGGGAATAPAGVVHQRQAADGSRIPSFAHSPYLHIGKASFFSDSQKKSPCRWTWCCSWSRGWTQGLGFVGGLPSSLATAGKDNVVKPCTCFNFADRLGPGKMHFNAGFGGSAGASSPACDRKQPTVQQVSDVSLWSNVMCVDPLLEYYSRPSCPFLGVAGHPGQQAAAGFSTERSGEPMGAAKLGTVKAAAEELFTVVNIQ
ncbi:hypothetical protein Vafri_8393, partial [Volvox africanus]